MTNPDHRDNTLLLDIIVSSAPDLSASELAIALALLFTSSQRGSPGANGQAVKTITLKTLGLMSGIGKRSLLISSALSLSQNTLIARVRDEPKKEKGQVRQSPWSWRLLPPPAGVHNQAVWPSASWPGAYHLIREAVLGCSLKPATLRVLARLAYLADSDGIIVAPLDELACACSISVKTVRRHIDLIERQTGEARGGLSAPDLSKRATAGKKKLLTISLTAPLLWSEAWIGVKSETGRELSSSHARETSQTEKAAPSAAVLSVFYRVACNPIERAMPTDSTATVSPAPAPTVSPRRSSVDRAASSDNWDDDELPDDFETAFEPIALVGAESAALSVFYRGGLPPDRTGMPTDSASKPSSAVSVAERESSVPSFVRAGLVALEAEEALRIAKSAGESPPRLRTEFTMPPSRSSAQAPITQPAHDLSPETVAAITARVANSLRQREKRRQGVESFLAQEDGDGDQAESERDRERLEGLLVALDDLALDRASSDGETWGVVSQLAHDESVSGLIIPDDERIREYLAPVLQAYKRALAACGDSARARLVIKQALLRVDEVRRGRWSERHASQKSQKATEQLRSFSALLESCVTIAITNEVRNHNANEIKRGREREQPAHNELTLVGESRA